MKRLWMGPGREYAWVADSIAAHLLMTGEIAPVEQWIASREPGDAGVDEIRRRSPDGLYWVHGQRESTYLDGRIAILERVIAEHDRAASARSSAEG